MPLPQSAVSAWETLTPAFATGLPGMKCVLTERESELLVFERKRAWRVVCRALKAVKRAKRAVDRAQRLLSLVEREYLYNVRFH